MVSPIDVLYPFYAAKIVAIPCSKQRLFANLKMTISTLAHWIHTRRNKCMYSRAQNHIWINLTTSPYNFLCWSIQYTTSFACAIPTMTKKRSMRISYRRRHKISHNFRKCYMCIYLLQLRWKYFSVSFMILKTGLHNFWCQSSAIYRDGEHCKYFNTTNIFQLEQAKLLSLLYRVKTIKIKHTTKLLTVCLDTRQGSLSVKSTEFIMPKHKLQVQIFLQCKGFNI